MDSLEKFKNLALLGGVLEGDIDAVRTLLDCGADSTFKPKSFESLEESHMSENEEEIKELLLKHKASLNQAENTEIDLVEKFKNFALVGAVEEEDVDAVRALLKKGADPNYEAKSQEYENLFEQPNVEIGKLLMDYGFKLDIGHIAYIFINTDSDYVKEVVPYIIGLIKDKKEVLFYKIFLEVLHCDYNLGPSFELEILKRLLKYGLPLDDYLVDEDDTRTCTALHIAVSNGRAHLVSYLLRLGADLNKRPLTEEGATSLSLAIEGNDPLPVTKVLLKHGVDVNERAVEGLTALHLATRTEYPGQADFELIHLLLDHGADVNITTRINLNSETPFTLSSTDVVKQLFVKHFAIMTLEGQKASDVYNLRDFDGEDEDTHLEDVYTSSLEELESIKNCEILDGLSLYDVLKMRKETMKLISLTRNEEFMNAFRTKWDRELFINYGDELDRIVGEAVKKRDAINSSIEIVNELGKKFFLPTEIVDMICDYVTAPILYF